ncbi:ABC transporter ATP-binding protein [Consotaella aegiceratis]|uniref:ABC transporter ATP-binding protein n=1 Tax=Consotaella aegiceratis TaxID=3097961 RepID=UPI002F3F93F8
MDVFAAKSLPVETAAGPTSKAAGSLLRLEAISKHFGALVANDEVSFDAAAGDVVALLGENGAGKSTAMNVLCGLYHPDSGRVTLDGKEIELGSPKASARAGIGMVHQQFKLVDALTAFENLSLALDRGNFLQKNRPSGDLASWMADLGFEIDLTQRVRDMPLAARQQLEIVRVLASGARILILDEPTSVLSPLETDRLFAIVRRIAASGRVVILISHKLAEIRDVATRLVVMRQGRRVFEGKAAGMSGEKIAELIVGERSYRNDRRPQAPVGEHRLTVRNLSLAGAGGEPIVKDVSFTVAQGELVAIVGVAGNGQIELLDAIGGLRRPATGEIIAPRLGSQRDFAFIPAQHLGVGLAPGLTLEENALLGHQARSPFGRLLRPRERRRRAQSVLAAYDVRTPARTVTSALSGGNLQRVVLGRELLNEPDLVVASYPTRGLDIASAAQIRNALIERANAGAAVLMACEELEESLEIATRILVMSGGRMVADLDAKEATLGELGRLITQADEAA